MKNIAINTLRYRGMVTISQYSGQKKIKLAQFHNEGGTPLFNFLASCLAGDFAIAKLTRPTKVMLIERTNPDKDEAPTFGIPTNSNGFIYTLTKPEKVRNTTGVDHVRYSFIVPKEVVNSLGSNSFKNLYLGLYTDEATEDTPGNYAAICKLDLSQNNLINASLAVDWELSFLNTSVEK